MPIHVGGAGGIPSTGIDTGIPFNGEENQGDFASTGTDELDPISTGNVGPDIMPIVWKTLKVWAGEGYELFGIDPENFELETHEPDPDSIVYSYSLKYIYNSGNTQVRQGVMNFSLPRKSQTNSNVASGQIISAKRQNSAAVIRMKTYLINRYLDNAENMGGMERDAAVIWSEKYVEKGFRRGLDSTVLFGFFLGLATLVGISIIG